MFLPMVHPSEDREEQRSDDSDCDIPDEGHVTGTKTHAQNLPGAWKYMQYVYQTMAQTTNSLFQWLPYRKWLVP